VTGAGTGAGVGSGGGSDTTKVTSAMSPIIIHNQSTIAKEEIEVPYGREVGESGDDYYDQLSLGCVSVASDRIGGREGKRIGHGYRCRRW